MLGNYDLVVTSPITNVRYTTSENFPCEIFLSNGSDPNIEYRSKSLHICEFAERRKAANLPVNVYAIEMFNLYNVVGIEYANSNPKKN